METRVKKKNTKYEAINRSSAEDRKLSLKAKGVMFYFLSKPDNWRGQLYDIVSNCTDGRTSAQSAIRELKAAGYIETITVVEEGLIKRRYYRIYDEKKKEF